MLWEKSKSNYMTIKMPRELFKPHWYGSYGMLKIQIENMFDKITTTGTHLVKTVLFCFAMVLPAFGLLLEEEEKG